MLAVTHPLDLGILIFGCFILAGITVYASLLRTIPSAGGKVRRELGLPDFLVTFVLGSFFSAIVIQVAFLGKPQSPHLPTARQIAQNALTMMVMVTGLAVFVAFRKISVRRMIGLDQVAIPRAIGIGLLLTGAAYPLVMGAGILTRLYLHQIPEEQELVMLFRSLAQEGSSSKAFLVIVAASVIVAPISEEFIFRGYFYPALKRFLGGIPGCLLTSLLFASYHLNLGALPALFVLALCFTIAYEATGSLVVPVTMHSLFNLSQLLLIYDQVQHSSSVQ